MLAAVVQALLNVQCTPRGGGRNGSAVRGGGGMGVQWGGGEVREWSEKVE